MRSVRLSSSVWALIVLQVLLLLSFTSASVSSDATWEAPSLDAAAPSNGAAGGSLFPHVISSDDLTPSDDEWDDPNSIKHIMQATGGGSTAGNSGGLLTLQAPNYNVSQCIPTPLLLSPAIQFVDANQTSGAVLVTVTLGGIPSSLNNGSFGTLTLLSQPSASINFTAGSTGMNQATPIQFVASSATAANVALASLTYTPAQGLQGTSGQVFLTVSGQLVTSPSTPQAFSVSYFTYAEPLNYAPLIIVPVDAQAFTNLTAPGNVTVHIPPIAVVDLINSQDELSVSFVIQNGYLFFGTTAGLVFLNDGNANSINFAGHLADVNNALANITFQSVCPTGGGCTRTAYGGFTVTVKDFGNNTECPIIAVMDCTLDRSPDGLSIIEAALPAPVVTPVTINNVTAYNVTWVTLQSTHWTNGGFSSDPTAYALLITSNPQVYGFAQVYYGLGTSFLLTNLAAGTTYTVEVEIYSVAGLTTCPGYTSQLTGRNVCAPNPTNFTTAGVRPNSASVALTGSSSTSLTFTTSPPAGQVDGLVYTVYEGNSTTGLVPLSSPFAVIYDVTVAGGAVVEVVMGLSPFTPYTIVVQARNEVGMGPATSVSAWTLLDGPSIIGFVASDPTNLDTAVSSGDLVTLTFDMATNQPSVASKADVDALLSFSAPIAADYSGQWLSPSVLQLTLTSVTTQSPAVGVETVTVVGNLRSADLVSDQSTAKATLVGNWGTYGLTAIFVLPSTPVQMQENAEAHLGVTASFPAGLLSDAATTYTLSVQLLSPILSGAQLSASSLWSPAGLVIFTNGTAAALQSVLSSVLFKSAQGYFGSASFQYTLTSSASVLVAEAVQVVSVVHVNHVPILQAPERLQVQLEQLTPVSVVSVSDVDVSIGSLTDSMTLTLSASTGGQLSFSGIAISGVSYAPSFSAPSGIFQLTGPMQAVNLALKALQVTFEYSQQVPGSQFTPFLLLSVNDHGNGGQPALSNAQHLYVDVVCPADNSKVLPAAVTSAQLSATGNELTLSLSLPVSVATLSTPFVSCASVFSSASVALFGAAPACHFVNTWQLQVELGVGATVSPATPLQVLANAFARCGGVATVSAAQLVAVVASPAAAFAPVAISGPSIGSLCEDLTLTAVTFASSAHALTYSWTLPPSFAQVNNTASIDLTSPTLLVPAPFFSLFTSTPTFTFGLKVTDFLGLSSQAQFDVEMDHSSKPLIQPLTAIEFSTSSDRALDLATSVTIPSCTAAPSAPVTSSGPAVSFTWTVVPALSGVSLGSAASLHLPANVLSYDANAQHAYTFTLTAKLVDNANLLSYQTFTVKVQPSALQARIAGGGLVTLPPAAALTLDASTSFDADASSASQSSEYSFLWSCQSAAPSGLGSSSACFGTDGNVLPSPNSAVLSFDQALLSTNSYVFTVVYRHIPTGRSSSASQTVQVADPYTSAPALQLNTAKTVINAWEQLAISAHASAAATFTWAVVGSGAGHLPLALAAPFNGSAMSALTLNAAQSAAFFESGATYTVEVTAVTAQGDSSTAAVAVHVNSPPTCQQPLSVATASGDSTGVALQSAYLLSIPSSSCGDADAQLTDLLSYQFFRYDAVSGLFHWLTAASPVSASSEVLLPTGASVVVGVRVSDVLGGYTDYTTSVSVSAPSQSTASALLSLYQEQTALATQDGDATTVAATIGATLATAYASSLASEQLMGLKDSLLTDLLSLSSSLPDEAISSVLALLLSDAASTSVSAAKYSLTFVAALSAGDSMAASPNELRSVVLILDGVVSVIAAGQGASGGGSRRRLMASALDSATLNALNSELFAALNSLAVDASSQVLTVEGDSLPISASHLSGLVQRGVIGGSPFTVTVGGSTVTVPSTSALSSVAPAGSPFDVAVIQTPASSFDYIAQAGQVSAVYLVGVYAAAHYSSPLAPHTSTSSLVSALPSSAYANATVTFDVAYTPSLAGSCLNSVDKVTGLVCSLECRQWNGTAFSAQGVATNFLALNTAQSTARCVLSQPGVLALFQATESSSILASSTASASTGVASTDQSAAVRASVTFPAPFSIVNMKDFKQGLVADLAALSGQPAARFNVEQVTTNSQNGLTTVILDIWVPTDSQEADSQSVYLQLAALTTTEVLQSSYLRYADLSSWMEQCSDLVFRATCSSSSSQSSWMLPLIISASVAGFLLLCALTVFAVRRFYSAPAKDDKALAEFTLPSASGAAKQYIYSPPTAGKEVDAELSRHEEVSDVTIVAGNGGIDPHSSQSASGADEEISEPVIVESEAEAAELAKHSDLGHSRSGESLPQEADEEEKESEMSMTRGSVSGQSRHFYYVDQSVNKESRTEVSTTHNSLSSRAPSQSTRPSRQSVSQAAAAPASRSHFRVSTAAAGPATAGALERERSTSASVSASQSSSTRQGGAAHFRYSDNEQAEVSTSRTPSLPHLSHSPSHSALANPPSSDAAFHTFSHLDLTDPAAPAPSTATEKKAIKVIRPGQH